MGSSFLASNWALLFLLGFAFLPSSFAQLCAVGGFNANLNISCSSGLIESILFSSYGNASGTCPTFVQSTCHSTLSMSVVSTECIGRTFCVLNASGSNFGSVCSSSANTFLRVVYSCFGLSPDFISHFQQRSDPLVSHRFSL
jgi:hypothetical protein